jgi:RecB family exonuclease
MDDARLYELAAAGLADASRGLGAVASYGLYDLPEMQVGLVRRLVAGPQAAVFVPWLDGCSEYAQRARDLFADLGFATRAATDDRSASACEGARSGYDASRPTVLSVADETAQWREAARAVLAAVEGGHEQHDVAVVVADAGGRERMARTLRDVGLEVAASFSETGRGTAAARLFLDCAFPDDGPPLRRDLVLALAAIGERGATATEAVVQWDLAARAARVVAGDDWRRLPPGASAASFVARLEEAAAGLPVSAPWPELAESFATVLSGLCGLDADDPVLAAVAALADLEVVDDEVDRRGFASAARAELDRQASRQGSVGRRGVAVVSPQGLRGLRPARVVFCDLAEGGFPARSLPDPLLPDVERSDLSLACGLHLSQAAERDVEADLLYGLALDAARDGVVLLYPRRSGHDGRPRLPSRLLLATCRAAAGRDVTIAELEADGAVDGLVRRIPGGPASFAVPAHGTALDLREFDLEQTWAAGGGEAVVAGAYLEVVLGPAAARRLSVLEARRAREVTPYDGCLSAAAAADAAAAALDRSLSPTAVERYLDCPFAFYLRHVLGLWPPDEPENVLEVEPATLGTLAHAILRETFAAIADDREAGREVALAAFAEAAERELTGAESHGLVGHPLAWRPRRAQLVADLHRTIARDPCWEDGCRPARLEWSFGSADEQPVTVRAGTREVSFKGRADRVDLNADSSRARVIDYKTGSGASEAQRVRAGRAVQLVVYLLAACGLVPQASHYDCEFRCVTRSGGFASLVLPPAPVNELRDGLGNIMQAMLAALEAGLYPRWYESRRCGYCDAAHGCGAERSLFKRKMDDPVLALMRAARGDDHERPS